MKKFIRIDNINKNDLIYYGLKIIVCNENCIPFNWLNNDNSKNYNLGIFTPYSRSDIRYFDDNEYIEKNNIIYDNDGYGTYYIDFSTYEDDIMKNIFDTLATIVLYTYEKKNYTIEYSINYPKKLIKNAYY